MWKVIHLPTGQIVKVAGHDYAVDTKEVAQTFIDIFFFHQDTFGSIRYTTNPLHRCYSNTRLNRCEFEPFYETNGGRYVFTSTHSKV